MYAYWLFNNHYLLVFGRFFNDTKAEHHNFAMIRLTENGVCDVQLY